ncbi:hypothetical protein OROMI_025479 [Orobanche minor]
MYGFGVLVSVFLLTVLLRSLSAEVGSLIVDGVETSGAFSAAGFSGL